MKKIAIIIESLQCGGAEKSLVTLLQNFDFRKFKVDLILFNDGGEFKKFVPKEVNLVHIVPFQDVQLITKVLCRIKYWILRKLWNKKYHNAQLFWKSFGKYIKPYKKGYDIAIAYNQGFATYYVADKVTAKIKYAWLNTDYKKAGYNINFDYQFYNYHNKIVCVSWENKKSIEHELKKINKNLPVTVIKDISDINFINKRSLENTGLVSNDKYTKILTVGRLAQAKGYGLALNACKILVDKGYTIKWFVIGDGPQRSEIEKLITENNLKDHFILLGFKENPYPYVKSCDIYVQPSLFEGLGLTVIEAAILQKPIVTTNFPTAATIVENNMTGLICEMSPEAIAASIERYLNDANLVEKVIKNLSLQKNDDKEESLKKINQLLNV